MQITKPKIRGKKVQEPKDVMKKIDTNKLLEFKDYCQLSLYCIEQSDDFFLSLANKEKHIKYLQSMDLNYGPKKQTPDAIKLDQQTKSIMKILTYAWKNIRTLIQNKRTNPNDNLGIYSDENINLHFARLDQMLLELKSKRYRCDVFIKQHAYSREIAEKEMNQQLVFIKLLQNILKTQTKKVEEERARRGNQIQNEPKSENDSKKQIQMLPKIPQIIDVNKYFQKKYAKKSEQTQVIKDAIDLQQQKRKFNSAVIRYHLQNSQRK